jgi:hypothetical protein
MSNTGRRTSSRSMSSKSRSNHSVRTDIMPLSSDIYSPISDIDYWIKK